MNRNYIILGATGAGLAAATYLIARRRKDDAVKTPVPDTFRYVYPAGPTGGRGGDDVLGGSMASSTGPPTVTYPASPPPQPIKPGPEIGGGCTNVWGGGDSCYPSIPQQMPGGGTITQGPPPVTQTD